MTLHRRPRKFRPALPAAILAISLLCACAARKTPVGPSTPQPPAASSSPAPNPLAWTEVSTPFPAVDITAVGNVFWVCGVDEMIASSSDGGTTWQLKHQNLHGKILMHIAFVNDKIGHAAGKGGLLLSTTDGGKTWKPHNAGDDVLAFSFADAKNGIAVIGWGGDMNRFMEPIYHPAPMPAEVKLSHDGGEHWEGIPVLNTDELKPFTRVLAVAALDGNHYLMIRNNDGIEDAFLVTADAGKSWKLIHQRNDDTNREFAKRVFVHEGEYWAFGQQLLDRQKGGGYMVSMTRRSKDGETWLPGLGAKSEMGVCRAQGCYVGDGTLETLYGIKEQYWKVPQDGSLSAAWAIAGSRACTIDTTIECGPAIPADQP